MTGLEHFGDDFLKQVADDLGKLAASIPDELRHEVLQDAREVILTVLDDRDEQFYAERRYGRSSSST